jgi:hypothetical protein
MSIPICTLKAGTKILDQRTEGLSMVLETEHPEDGYKIFRFTCDTQAPNGIRVEVTSTAKDAVASIEVGYVEATSIHQ